MSRENITISISIPKNLIKWVDEQCKSWKVSRSWLISNLLWTSMVRCSDEHTEGSNEH